MRIFAIFALLLLAVPIVGHTQSTIGAEPPAPDRSYKLLSEDQDWNDRSLRPDFWDRIKFIPLRSNRDNWVLSIGGEAREVWEQIGNDNWGRQPFTSGYFNERYMLYFDTHYGKHVRTFVELKSGLNSYRIDGPRPFDEKKLDFQAAFLEWGTSGAENSIKIRAGRQQLEYGSGRLVDVREGPNVRVSFDGFLIRVEVKSWHIDGFAVRPDRDKPGFFNNVPNHSVSFWGAYVVRPMPQKTLLDVYYLGLDRRLATFERGTAQEVRHSLGARLARPVPTEKPGWDFDYEALWQFGSFGAAHIRAWGVASDTGFRVPTWRLKPRFSAKADISKGDHRGSSTLGTFNPLFPKGGYFGVLTTTGPGPINFIDLHPHIESTLPKRLTASFDWIFQWRESLDDGVYDLGGFLIRGAGESRARFVGHRPGTEIRWQANGHLWFQADYGIFYAGRFLKDTKPERNLNYWALWTGYKF